MRIIKLSINNFMGIEAAHVELEDEGQLVIIGGDNGAGKTSLLDAIECNVRGKDRHPAMPIRHGASGAQVIATYAGEDSGLPWQIEVERRWKPGKQSVVVRSADGFKRDSPQKMLDRLAGAISFDPSSFWSMDAKKRLALVRDLAGVSTGPLDREYDQRFEERREVGIEQRQLDGQVAGLVIDEDAADKTEAIAYLGKQHNKAMALAQAHDDAKVEHDQASHERELANQRVEHWRLQVTNAERALEDARACLVVEERDETVCRGHIETAEGHLADHPDNAEQREEIRLALVKVQDEQRAFELGEQSRVTVKQRDEKKARYDELTAKLDELKGQKKTLIAAGAKKLPVHGLSFSDEDGVTLFGVPFDQANLAQRLRCSIAMGMALNPQLHLILVREGSALDGANMKLLEEMAIAEGYTIWVERVGDRDDNAIVIEDGRIVGQAVEPDEADDQAAAEAEQLAIAEDDEAQRRQAADEEDLAADPIVNESDIHG